MITLRQLRYVEAIARLGHFGRAAEQCAVTQPALSLQIKLIEEELGVSLFERLPRGVRPTPEGAEIARRAARVLAEVRDITDFARVNRDPLTGPLNLGVIPTVAPYLLPQMLPILRERHAGLELRVRESRTEHLLEALADGALDVLLLALPVERDEFAMRAVMADRFLLAVPASRKIGAKVRATPDLLKADRLLLLEEGHCLRDQALAVCELREADTVEAFGASSLATIVQLVANDLGLTLLPEISLAVEAQHRAITVLRFADPEPMRTLGLVWRKSSPREADCDALAGVIAEVGTKLDR
ncbi:MAG: LysR family transcriptional regulator [Hyphomicrobiaceae bacterium]|nr:LysR family transcriptional regulator [Hyphomicrobiaceae bacterium]